MYTWETRYNKGFIPDQQGRWASDMIFQGLRVASVTRMDGFYRLMTFFPVTNDDFPLFAGKYATWADAKKEAEILFVQFIKTFKHGLET